MNKVLGLDIGISSVGWGLINQDTGEIIDAGVRLFEEADRNANENRRDFRGARRVKRRRNHRLERARELFIKNSLPLSGIGKIDPYKSRYNSIYGEVTKEELVAGLYHLIKRRGTTLDAPDDEKTTGDELSTKEQLSINERILRGRYICEVQLERLSLEDGKVRSHENRFRTEDYLKEAKAILLNQKKVHSELTDEFISEIIGLIERRRQYFEGPGSKVSPTPYGPFYIDENGILQETSMINKMRGRCTYFPNEFRIAKMAYTADLFNLLSNDLNKIQIEGEYLTTKDKEYLINNFINKGRNITLNQILKYKGYSNDAIVTGCRIDLKSDKPIFTEFKGYKELRKIVADNSLPNSLLSDIDIIDGIIDILTAEKSYERREVQLKDLLINKYDNATIDRVIKAVKETNKFTGYHSLSKKALTTIMDDLWATNKNQMELFAERGADKSRLSNIKSSNHIKFDDQAILSTVAKRAHREAIKIVNEIRAKYGEMSAIVVETAREKNSEEKRKRYRDFQRSIGKHEKKMSKLLGVDTLKELYLNGKQHLALKLWDSQDGKCIYSGKSISVNDIIKDPTLFEIDHIIPISISFDDSQANKVLCYQGENQKKGQRTPYQYLSTGNTQQTFDQFKVRVMDLHKSRKINNKKRDYLLEIRDVKNNERLQKEFINRNLIDTQYAMISFSRTLRNFFNVNDIDTKVLSIRGSFTAALRRQARLNKDRDEGHAHHAIDALIVAAIGRMPVFTFFKEFDMNEQGVVFSRETGEILQEDEFFKHNYINFLSNLRNYESKIKYSHKVDRKVNRGMSNQTIYGTREYKGETYYLGKTSNIYNLDKSGVESLLNRIKKKPEHFLIAQHNPDLFELILKIIVEYKTSPNPFKSYYDENGYILKDGKVPVKTLRYLDKKLGVHMDITDKYPNSKNPVVLLSIKSLRVDIYKNAEGKYKYLGVPYHWFRQKGNRYYLDMNKYNNEKLQSFKNIDESFEFQFSLYRNDRFSYEKDNVRYERIFIGDNNPRRNVIETDYIFKKKEEQKYGFLSISTVNDMFKYNVDVLGNTYLVERENFESSLQL